MNLHPGGRSNQAMTAFVLAEKGTICWLCLRPGATTRDHIVPRARGGADSLDNCEPAHRRCNSRRGARPVTAALLAQFRRPVADIAADAGGFFENQTPRTARALRSFSPESPQENSENARNSNERQVS